MPKNNDLLDIGGYREMFATSKKDVRKYYHGKPLQLAEEAYGIYFPPKGFENNSKPGLRELIDDVCNLRVTRAVATAPRGGGKSFGVSFCEWYLNCFYGFDWLNLGGAEQQALAVYSYIEQFINSHTSISSHYPKGTLMTYTESSDGAWISVLTASPRSVRSPHAGGIRIGDITARLEGLETGYKYLGGSGRGGGLTIDEECEADPNIVNSATPMVNTADPSVILRISTFHKVDGSFAHLIDNYDRLGYKFYTWDCFDICQQCTYDCEECFEDFRDDVYTTDPTTKKRVLRHKAYCGGKAKRSQGWMPVKEIFDQFREHQLSLDWFEVEMMGWRPSSSGHVIKNLHKFNNECVVDDNEVEWMPGYQSVITVDWGLAGECCVQVWQSQPQSIKAMLEDEHFVNGEPEDFIYEVVYGYGAKYKTNEVWADSSHPYCNNTLKTHPRYRMNVREVNFQTEKELAAGSFNAHVDNGWLKVPRRFKTFIQQVNGWKRKNGKIDKKNDHGCDAALCYMLRFATEAVPSGQRVMPITFVPGMYAKTSSGLIVPSR